MNEIKLARIPKRTQLLEGILMSLLIIAITRVLGPHYAYIENELLDYKWTLLLTGILGLLSIILIQRYFHIRHNIKILQDYINDPQPIPQETKDKINKPEKSITDETTPKPNPNIKKIEILNDLTNDEKKLLKKFMFPFTKYMQTLELRDLKKYKRLTDSFVLYEIAIVMGRPMYYQIDLYSLVYLRQNKKLLKY